MRAAIALAILIGTSCTAFAGGGFEIVIPGRPGVPIIINGVDASYAVVEGDWGLGKGVQVQTKVYGGRYVDPVPNVGHYYPSAGLVPGYGRLEIRTAGQPQAAAARRELSSVMVGAIQSAAAGAGRRTVLSAAGDRRAANRHPAATVFDRASRSFHTKSPRQQKTDPQERVMRQTISGMVAAVAVMMTVGASPAMACYGACAPAPVYVAPAPVYSGCNTGCGGWGWPASGCPIRCSSIITSTRARPIPARATGRRVRSIRKMRCPPGAVTVLARYRYARPISNYYDGPAARAPRVYGYRANRYGYRYGSPERPLRLCARLRLRVASLACTRHGAYRARSARRCCAATTDLTIHLKYQRPFASRERALCLWLALSPSGRACWRRYRAPAPPHSTR